MRRASIDLTGPGMQAIVAAVPGKRIIIHRMVLTFSHAEVHSQKVSFLSGSTVIAGPFYVLDGGEIEYKRRAGDPDRIGPAEAFNVDLAEGLSAAGSVEYELGAE